MSQKRGCNTVQGHQPPCEAGGCTWIAPDTRIVGRLASRTDRVEIGGRVYGQIVAPTHLTVDSTGVVVGEVEAGSADLAGRVSGTTAVDRTVRVRATGALDGELTYGRLGVEEGARVTASLHRTASPLEEAEISPVARVLASPPVTKADRHTPPSSAHARPPRHGVSPPRWASWAAVASLALIGTASLGIKATEARPVVTPAIDVDRSQDRLEQEPEVYMSYPWFVIPPERMLPSRPERPPSLDDISWTTRRAGSIRTLAMRWGMSSERLAALNPQLAIFPILGAGTSVRVYRSDPTMLTRSVGAPNRGRLINGVPMPEGSSWRARSRHRVYGSPETIDSLVSVFRAFGRAFPDAPPIPVGDLSLRDGTALAPHRSHQSGRDVDVFYVRTGKHKNALWPPRITSETFDAEKNWFVVKSLIDTGTVHAVFMAARPRQWLLDEARTNTPPDEIDWYFDVIDEDTDHRGHMHVRFRCPPDDRRCRTHSLPDGVGGRSP